MDVNSVYVGGAPEKSKKEKTKKNLSRSMVSDCASPRREITSNSVYGHFPKA